jgi:hypothetical protein
MAKKETSAGSKEQITDLVKMIPLLGNFLAWLIKYRTIKELIFGIVGFSVGWTIVYFGHAPEFIISIYRVTQPPPAVAPKPDHIDYKAKKDAPEWSQPYVYWLEQEGDELKKQNLIQDYKMCFLTSEEITAKSTANDWVFEEFKWELSTERDCEIKGYAFNLNKEDFSKLLEPGIESPASLSFVVPAYRKGSKLFSIARISWNQNNEPPACESIRSTVKK